MEENMKKSKLGILIHGAGWVSTQHIEAYKNNPFTEIVAISSRTLEGAQARAKDEGLDVPVFDNYEKALTAPGVDIVSVCTPQHLHADNVILAAQAQKHIVIEKPACQTLDELQRMQTAVKKAQVKTIVSFVLRWNPLFQMLKRMTRDDTFGEIYSVETDYQSYCGDWWGGFPMGRTVAMGGSAFLTAGCHAIDALRWFAAQDEYSAADPAEVFAYQGGKRGQSTRQYNPLTNDWHEGDPLEFPGLEMALVKFSNGVLGKVSANFECIQPYALPIEIFGDKGTVKDNKVWSHKYPGQKDWIELPTICPDNADVSHHPFQGEIDHFIDCVHHDQESHCNLDDAAKTHEIVFGAFESYRTGQPVKLPLAIES
jgi:predicted dehydrogenase